MSRVTWNGLVLGGKYELVQEGAFRAPIFTFEVTDVSEVERFLGDHYVHFEVRWDDEDRMAYFMSAPDLSPDVAAIAVPYADHIWVQAGSGLRDMHTTSLVDAAGGSLSLERFAKGVHHDWTQAYARADRAFTAAVASPEQRAEHLETARKLLASFHSELETKVAAAHRLYGRVWMMLHEREMAIYHLAEAVRRSVDGARLVPAAAGPLFDLALAFEDDGKPERALKCLHHALVLRPSYGDARVARERLAKEHDVTTDPATLGTLDRFELDVELIERWEPPEEELVGATYRDAPHAVDAATSPSEDAQRDVDPAAVDEPAPEGSERAKKRWWKIW